MPGGYHLMLIQARRKIAPGNTIKIELHFSVRTTLETALSIRPPASNKSNIHTIRPFPAKAIKKAKGGRDEISDMTSAFSGRAAAEMANAHRRHISNARNRA